MYNLTYNIVGGSYNVWVTVTATGDQCRASPGLALAGSRLEMRPEMRTHFNCYQANCLHKSNS